MSDFLKGFIKGAKETPKGFFAPAVAIFRLFRDVTDSLLSKKNGMKNGMKHA